MIEEILEAWREYPEEILSGCTSYEFHYKLTNIIKKYGKECEYGEHHNLSYISTIKLKPDWRMRVGMSILSINNPNPYIGIGIGTYNFNKGGIKLIFLNSAKMGYNLTNKEWYNLLDANRDK